MSAQSAQTLRPAGRRDLSTPVVAFDEDREPGDRLGERSASSRKQPAELAIEPPFSRRGPGESVRMSCLEIGLYAGVLFSPLRL